MTQQQAACLAFIRRYVAEHGFSPTYEEIGEALGMASKSGVSRVLSALVEQHRIRRRPNSARSVELIDGYGRNVQAQVERIIERWCAAFEGEPPARVAAIRKIVTEEIR